MNFWSGFFAGVVVALLSRIGGVDVFGTPQISERLWGGSAGSGNDDVTAQVNWNSGGG